MPMPDRNRIATRKPALGLNAAEQREEAVDGEVDHERGAPPDPVGDPAHHERTEELAQERGAEQQAELGAVEGQLPAEHRGDGAGEEVLVGVEEQPEPDHQRREPVDPGDREPVEAGGDRGGSESSDHEPGGYSGLLASYSRRVAAHRLTIRSGRLGRGFVALALATGAASVLAAPAFPDGAVGALVGLRAAARVGTAPAAPPAPTASPAPRVTARAKARTLAGRTVVLDAGHQLGNARFPGEISAPVDAGGLHQAVQHHRHRDRRRLPRGDVRLGVVSRVRDALERLGATVLLTRDDNSAGAVGAVRRRPGPARQRGLPGPGARRRPQAQRARGRLGGRQPRLPRDRGVRRAGTGRRRLRYAQDTRAALQRAGLRPLDVHRWRHGAVGARRPGHAQPGGHGQP